MKKSILLLILILVCLCISSCEKPKFYCIECQVIGTGRMEVKECSDDEKYLDGLIDTYNKLSGGKLYYCRKVRKL